MAKNTGENARDSLVAAGIDLMRRSGYVATTVDEICTAAGLTKGAFFHHFLTKEAFAQECLRKWQEQMVTLHGSAAYQEIEDPVRKVLAAIDFMTEVFANPDVQKSCFAGTTAQEVSETNPVLREAAHQCFVQGEEYFSSLLDDACHCRGIELNTASLAEYWMGTIQGALLLSKASEDPSVIGRNLTHFKSYVAGLLGSTGK